MLPVVSHCGAELAIREIFKHGSPAIQKNVEISPWDGAAPVVGSKLPGSGGDILTYFEVGFPIVARIGVSELLIKVFHAVVVFPL